MCNPEEEYFSIKKDKQTNYWERQWQQSHSRATIYQVFFQHCHSIDWSGKNDFNCSRSTDDSQISEALNVIRFSFRIHSINSFFKQCDCLINRKYFFIIFFCLCRNPSNKWIKLLAPWLYLIAINKSSYQNIHSRRDRHMVRIFGKLIQMSIQCDE